MPSQRHFDPRLGPFKPGDRLEQYEIGRLLAALPHAFVYEAQHTGKGPLLAIKVMVSSGADRELLQRVQSELRVLSRLDHPRLVREIDAGVVGEDLVYIVLERLEGRTLREVYREHGRLTPAEVLAIGAQIAQGVEAAHAAKIIHGDLKPENVFVQQSNEVKVLGFSIARLLDQPGHDAQRDPSHETELYKAPEQLRGLGVTPRSDIFSLGTVLYEGLVGKLPTLVAEALPDLAELVPGLPRHVTQLVHKMIAEQPADRHGSMREVAEALTHGSRRLLEGSGGRSDLRPLWRKAGEVLIDSAPPRPALTSSDPTPPPAAATGRFEAHRPARSRTVVLAASIAVGAGVAIAVTASRVSQSPDVLAPSVESPSSAVTVPPPPTASTSASAPASASASAPASAPVPASALPSARARKPAPRGSAPDAQDPRKPWLE